MEVLLSIGCQCIAIAASTAAQAMIVRSFQMAAAHLGACASHHLSVASIEGPEGASAAAALHELQAAHAQLAQQAASFANAGVPAHVAPQLCSALGRAAAALEAWWALPEHASAQQLEVAQVAALRSCAYMRCANVAAQGGPAAGQGVGSMRCR